MHALRERNLECAIWPDQDAILNRDSYYEGLYTCTLRAGIESSCLLSSGGTHAWESLKLTPKLPRTWWDRSTSGSAFVFQTSIPQFHLTRNTRMYFMKASGCLAMLLAIVISNLSSTLCSMSSSVKSCTIFPNIETAAWDCLLLLVLQPFTCDHSA